MSSIRIDRPRRLRQSNWVRALVAENRLSVDDLIWPLIVKEGHNEREAIASMPGVERLSIDLAVEAAREAADLGIPMLSLFPYEDPKKRDEKGSEALNPDNLICRALKAIKEAGLDIGLMVDVALDPYTSHGHDGLLENGKILNDETIEVLCQQSLTLVQAGADCLGPSDMMDGRVGDIRFILENEGFQDILIMAYAAKYASRFYGPFRDAIGSNATLQGDKRSYQMDPRNSDEALREIALDLSEGADMVMVKPGMPYLDIIYRIKKEFQTPTFAYQVSGEYAMLKAAGQQGWLSEDDVVLESLLAFKRAGADGILTYFARDIAKRLR